MRSTIICVVLFALVLCVCATLNPVEQIDVASGTQVRVARAPQFGRGRGFGRRFRQGGYGGYGGPGFYPGGYGGYPGGGYGGYPGGGFGGYPGGFGNAGGFGGSSSQSQASAQSFNFNTPFGQFSGSSANANSASIGK